MPVLLENALKDKGAKYEKADNWQKKVTVSERLVTGQNPASAEGMLSTLKINDSNHETHGVAGCVVRRGSRNDQAHRVNLFCEIQITNKTKIYTPTVNIRTPHHMEYLTTSKPSKQERSGHCDATH